MTDDTYPNKDIYYLPEKTPVYIITNPQDPGVYANYKKTVQSFERFGYKDVRLQHIVYNGEVDRIQEEEFPTLAFNERAMGNQPMRAKRHWLLFLRLMKKAARYNGPIIVSSSNALLIKDIHNNRESEGMFALGGMPIGSFQGFKNSGMRSRLCLDLNMGYVVYPSKARKILDDVLTWYTIDHTLSEGFPAEKFIPMATQIFPPEYQYMITNDDISTFDD